MVLLKNKNCLREKLVTQCSSMRDDKVFEDSVKTLRATLMVEQFFCGKVTLDKAALHESVKTGDCKPAFSPLLRNVRSLSEAYMKIRWRKSPKKFAREYMIRRSIDMVTLQFHLIYVLMQLGTHNKWVTLSRECITICWVPVDNSLFCRNLATR